MCDITPNSLCILLMSTAMIPVLFNPFIYSVTEGVDSNAVITLEALANHPDFAFNVTVLSQSGSAIGGLCEWNRAPYASTVYIVPERSLQCFTENPWVLRQPTCCTNSTNICSKTADWSRTQRE